MALYPGATQMPLGKSTLAMASFDILCLHTMVGTLDSTNRYFRSVGTFSHFGIGGIWGGDVAANLDGVVYQWGDTARRAAANLDGNNVIISVETADNFPEYPSDILAWTPKQQTAIVNIMVWAHRTHGIPLVLIPDTLPGRKGIAYHKQGCNPFRISGGVLWSSSTGKECPTNRRIAQIPGLIERARAIVAGEVTEELDNIMAYYASKADFEAAVARIVKGQVDASNKFINIRALAAAFTGGVNQVYSEQGPAAGWSLKEQLEPLLAAVIEAKAANAALLAAIQTLGGGLDVDPAVLQEMLNTAAREAVKDLDLDVVLVPKGV